jgi:hypothetical protein
VKRIVVWLGALAALVLSPTMAQAEFGFKPGYPKLAILDAVGGPYATAGGHPDRILIQLGFNLDEGKAAGNPKEIQLRLPPGFSGNAADAPVCLRHDFGGAEPFEDGNFCPPESQIGVFTIWFGEESFETPLYNIETLPDEAGLIGGTGFGKNAFPLQIRPDDFGLTIRQPEMIQTLVLGGSDIELWGIPADHLTETPMPRRPFVTLPARCDAGPLPVTVAMRSWQEPDRWVTATADTGTPLTGCDALSFQPTVGFSLDNPSLDSPSGATIGLDLPQSEDPNGRASIPTKAASVVLPAGVSISPGAAGGLTACADADLHRGSSQPAACPPTAKVGTVELDGPQTRQPLTGTLYLGQERPGERFRFFVVAEDGGISAKFVGTLQVDPVSGRTTARLEDLPELAFAHIGLHFDGGPRALLTTPLTCGSLGANGTFTPHGGFKAVQSSASTSVEHGVDGGPCPARPPFAPSFSGGSTNARAGAATGVTVTLRRQGGEQLPDRFSTELPAGLSAALGSVERCGDQASAAGSCPAASRVGSVVAELGSGPRLAKIDGDAYLGGPYKGAPFSLALVLDAAIGPFDFGTEVTRAAVRVDRTTARVSIETDSLPREIEGIPVRFRTIGLDIDRPGFLRNPTSCEPAAVEISVRSVTGAVSRASNPFAVSGCDSLRFRPELAMRLTNKAQLHANGDPGMRIGIRARGQNLTNTKGADIALPGYLRLNSASKREICARQAAIEGRCQALSKVGTATGHMPMLDGRLEGTIHLVQPEGKGPPELWTTIDSTGVRFDIHGKLSNRDGRVHTNLVDLPDAPMTDLSLQLKGGKHGILSLKSNPCAPKARRARATVAFEGQNRAYRIEREAIEGCGR